LRGVFLWAGQPRIYGNILRILCPGGKGRIFSKSGVLLYLYLMGVRRDRKLSRLKRKKSERTRGKPDG